MNCPTCGKQGVLTKTKPRKSDGKTFPVYECSGDCKNDRGYKASWFPPKQARAVAPGAVVSQPSISTASEMLRELQEIKAILLKIAFKKPENKTIQPNEDVDDIDSQILDNDQDGTPF
jgi:hypothetical protein